MTANNHFGWHLFKNNLEENWTEFRSLSIHKKNFFVEQLLDLQNLNRSQDIW